jgi:hypothetical protein
MWPAANGVFCHSDGLPALAVPSTVRVLVCTPCVACRLQTLEQYVFVYQALLDDLSARLPAAAGASSGSHSSTDGGGSSGSCGAACDTAAAAAPAAGPPAGRA